MSTSPLTSDARISLLEGRVRELEERQARTDLGIEALALATWTMLFGSGHPNRKAENARRHLAIAITILGIKIPDAA